MSDIYTAGWKREISAAADVLKKAYDGGGFIVDPVEVATAMLVAANQARSRGHRFVGRSDDGCDIKVFMEDKGDVLPGYDSNRNRFEAFTTYLRVTFADGRNGGVCQNYVQVDRFLAEASGNVCSFRVQEDIAVLASMGVDFYNLVLQPS